MAMFHGSAGWPQDTTSADIRIVFYAAASSSLGEVVFSTLFDLFRATISWSRFFNSTCFNGSGGHPSREACAKKSQCMVQTSELPTCFPSLSTHPGNHRDEGCAQRIARHPFFDNLTILVVMANSVWLGVDADLNQEPLWAVGIWIEVFGWWPMWSKLTLASCWNSYNQWWPVCTRYKIY